MCRQQNAAYAPPPVEACARTGDFLRLANRDSGAFKRLNREPERTSRSRIKRLRGLRRPQYRLRIGEVRVFYGVSGMTVEVLAIVAKSEVESWLAQFGSPE